MEVTTGHTRVYNRTQVGRCAQGWRCRSTYLLAIVLEYHLSCRLGGPVVVGDRQEALAWLRRGVREAFGNK